MTVDDVALRLQIEVSLVAVDLHQRPGLGGRRTCLKTDIIDISNYSLFLPGGRFFSERLLVEPAFFMLPILLMWSTSTEGTTIVMSKVSPLNRRCLCDECRWFNTNSAKDKKLHSGGVGRGRGGYVEVVGLDVHWLIVQ